MEGKLTDEEQVILYVFDDLLGNVDNRLRGLINYLDRTSQEIEKIKNQYRE